MDGQFDLRIIPEFDETGSGEMAQEIGVSERPIESEGLVFLVMMRMRLNDLIA